MNVVAVASRLCGDPSADEAEMRSAFDDVFDQVSVFHGYVEYMRDYEIYVYNSRACEPGRSE